MENNFNNRDFEQFVKQNADQYRMFPSEKVWNNIHNTLHTRRRWYGIGLSLLLLTTGVVTWVMLNNSQKNRPIASTIPTFTEKQIPEPKTPAHKALVIAPAKPSNTATSFITPAESLRKNIYIHQEPVESFVEETVAVAPDEEVPSIMAQPAKTEEPVQAIVTLKNIFPAREVSTNKTISSPTIAIRKANNYSFVVNTPEPKTEATVADNVIADEKPLIMDGSFPLTIESVVNSYTYVPKRRGISFEVYFSPTISYRELKENKDFINSARNNGVGGAAPVSTPYSADVNSSVTHKPDVGLQLGFAAGYPITKNLRVIGGLQFNISKYDIRAYTTPAELTTIALSNPNGRTNTVYTLTNYRNDGGFKANWLHNLYFSASAPIGLE